MKYLLSCLLLLLAVCSLKAQKMDSAAMAPLSPELKQQVNNYLIEAKKARTAAMVMSIGGGALAFGGALVYTATFLEDDSEGNVGSAMFFVGVACVLGSIPLYIKVHKKHNAARAIVFADKGMTFTPNTIMPGTRSAGIRLVIPLGK